MVQEYLVILKKVIIVLDLIQADSCTNSKATPIWLGLQRFFFKLETHNASMIDSF